MSYNSLSQIPAQDSGEHFWQADAPHSAHEELLRQDRERLIRAGIGGTAMALAMIGLAFMWVSWAGSPQNNTTTSAIPLPASIAKPVRSVLQRSDEPGSGIAATDTRIETGPTGLKASEDVFSAVPKKVKSLVLETKAE